MTAAAAGAPVATAARPRAADPPSVAWSMTEHRPRARLLSVDEYLRLEERAAVKHEYVGGRVYAMTGVTLAHERVVNNVHFALRSQLRGAPCELFTKEVKVRTGDQVYYPDLVARCGPRLPGDTVVVADPCLLVEVLSPRTRTTDRREKRLAYQRIPTLRAYLVVEPRWRLVEHWFRTPDGRWDLAEATGADTIALDCPPATLALDAIYADLDVPDRPVRRLREQPGGGYRRAVGGPATGAHDP